MSSSMYHRHKPTCSLLKKSLLSFLYTSLQKFTREFPPEFKGVQHFLMTFACFYMELPIVSSENKPSPYNQHTSCSTFIPLSPSGIRDGLSEVGSFCIAMTIKEIFNTQWYLIFLPAKRDSERLPSIQGSPRPR